MKSVLIALGIYVITGFIATVFFIGLFQTPLFKDTIFCYRGWIFVLFSTLLMMILMHVCQRKCAYLTIKDTIIACICFSSITFGWFTLIPVAVERSISVNMLGYMTNHENTSFTQEEFQQIFIENYLNKHQAMSKRFDEQENSGNIKKDKSGYRITQKGKNLVGIFKLIAKLFNTDKWVVEGE